MSDRIVITRKRTADKMSEEAKTYFDQPTGVLFLKSVINHWKLLAAVAAVAAGSSFLFTSSVFMTPQYKAEAIIYPAGANTSESLITSDIRFGSDRDIDNTIQVLKSSIVRDSVVAKYGLYSEYGIDPKNPRAAFEMSGKFDDNIVIERTRYNSIAIRVFDQDADKAAIMANDIAHIGDEVKAEIIRKNLRKVYASAESELKSKMLDLRTISDSITFLRNRNYREALAMRGGHFREKENVVSNLRTSIDKVRNKEGIYDLSDQYNTIYKAYLQADANFLADSGMVSVMSKHLPANDTSLIRRKGEMEGYRILSASLNSKLGSLNRSSRDYNTLIDNYNFEKSVLSSIQGDYEFSKSTFEKEYSSLPLQAMKDRYNAELGILSSLKTKYELALSNLTDEVPASYMVSPATPSYHKARPQTLLICLVLTLSVLLSSAVVLTAIDNSQGIRSSIKTS